MSDREDALQGLQEGLGYTFHDWRLLEQALRHRSAAHEQQVDSYERLEFLGDAALSHAVGAMLFAAWPEAAEGPLTRGRAALVKEATLAEVARGLGIGRALELGSGLRDDGAGPSLLADALEAVLGALLLDGGWRTFQRTVRRLLGPALRALDAEQLDRAEPKSVLQELAQKRGWPLPHYREAAIRGPAHARIYVYEVELQGQVVGQGEGSSKRAAQQAAAAAALASLPATPSRAPGSGVRGPEAGGPSKDE